MSSLLLKLHRWVALVFALPLVAVLGTGLILSFEPWLVVRAIEPGALNAATIQALLDRHDPNGQARALAYRSYDKTLTVGGGGSGVVVDVATGQRLSGPSTLANVLVTARRMHETLLMNARGVVVASTVAMLALALLGMFMGWPRFANTLSGWHKGLSWGLLPLIVLSPLTGLFLSAGISFTGTPQGATPAQGGPLRLAEAVRIVGERHDLSGLVWIRSLGGRMVARVAEGGEYVLYAVTRDGTTALPRNWPRLWHEGNFAGAWSAFMNLVTSLAMIGLLITGPWIWLRRRLRRRARRRQAVAPA